MTYKEIYKSYLGEISTLEKKSEMENKNTHKNLILVRTKLSYYEKEMREMEILEKAGENFPYYITKGYGKSYSELRRKVIYRLNVLMKLASEIENLINTIESRRNGYNCITN